jgi:hypothetical protein
MNLANAYRDEMMRDGTRGDLVAARRVVKGWLDGKEIAADDAYYIGMLMLNLAQRVDPASYSFRENENHSQV